MPGFGGNAQAQSWIIDIGLFDVRLLPYITVNWACKPTSEEDKEEILDYVAHSQFFEVSSSESSDENFKNVIMHLCVTVEDTRSYNGVSPERPWYLKPIISLYNPRRYT